MMKLLMTAITCTLIVAAAPAGAAEAEADRTSAEATSEKAGQKAVSRKTKYCATIAPDVGSRIPTRQCRTKAEWLRDGIDIDNGK